MNGDRTLLTIFLVIALGGVAVAFWNSGDPGRASTVLTDPAEIKPGSLLLFTQEGCPPCRKLEAMLQSETVSAFFKQTGVHIMEINTRQHQDLVRKYDVHVTPTLIILDNESKERSRRVGAMEATAFMDWVRARKS